MKKVSALLCSLAAVFALVGCSKGTEVSAEEFKEKAAQVQEKVYSSAVVEYDIDNYSKYGGSEEASTLKKSGKLEVTFEGGKPVEPEADKDVYKQIKQYFKADMLAVVGQLLEGVEYYKSLGVEVEATYYVDPFGFSIEGSGKYEKAGQGSGSLEADVYIRFNEYGYVDLLELEFNAEGKSIYEGVTYEQVEKTNIEFAVEYK